jgi:hypothetical protein
LKAWVAEEAWFREATPALSPEGVLLAAEDTQVRFSVCAVEVERHDVVDRQVCFRVGLMVQVGCARAPVTVAAAPVVE